MNDIFAHVIQVYSDTKGFRVEELPGGFPNVRRGVALHYQVHWSEKGGYWIFEFEVPPVPGVHGVILHYSVGRLAICPLTEEGHLFGLHSAYLGLDSPLNRAIKPLIWAFLQATGGQHAARAR